MRNIQLSVRDISEGNKRQKYLAATRALAKALDIPITVKRKDDDEKAERSPYKLHDELVEKWTKYFADIMDTLYKKICAVLDLPMVTTFSKALEDDWLIWKGKILYSPETGLPITKRQWEAFLSAIERYLNSKLSKAGEKIVLDAVAAGRILNRMLKYNTWEAVSKLGLKDVKYKNRSFDWVTDDIKNLKKIFDLSDYELGRIQIAQESAAQYVRAIDDRARSTIRQALINGVKDKKTKSEVAQSLFDSLGSLNRDWTRIVEYETADNLDSAFLLGERSQAEQGGKVYFQRIEVRDKVTCPHCRRINGIVALWSDVPLNDEKIDDPYAKIAIWEGKTRVGHKTSDSWVAAGPQHPFCRGSWARWEPPSSNKKNKGLSFDAAMAKLRGRQNKWADAVDKAKAEFAEKGIKNPTDATPGYIERINELYNS
jgi:hypothetical protein